jgi:hypothetical protein
MQPLDVGIFHPYKHWHDVAIKNILAKLDIKYSLVSFLHNLKQIQEQTFDRKTIKSAWKKSGMWPPNVDRCLKNLKKFTPPEASQDKSEELTLPQTPGKPSQVEMAIYKWEEKIPDILSSGSRP